MRRGVLPRAPRLASTSARAAAPRRARSTGSPSSPTHDGLELRARPDLHRRAVVEERAGDLGEVLHVRPEHDRLAVHGRLEDVVAARIDQAAADEHRPSRSGTAARARRSCRGSTTSARGSASTAQLACGGRRVSPPRAPALGLGEALGLARRDDEQRVRHARADALERREHRRLFALQRAGRDEHRPVAGDPEVAEHAVRRAAVGRRRRPPRELERVELQAAGDDDPLADRRRCR